jgi:hypothetical protein
MESGRTTGQTAHSGVDIITTTEGPTDFVKNIRKTAHSAGESTICTGKHMVFGKGTVQTAPSHGDIAIYTGLRIGSLRTAPVAPHIIKDTFSPSNDKDNKPI